MMFGILARLFAPPTCQQCGRPQVSLPSAEPSKIGRFLAGRGWCCDACDDALYAVTIKMHTERDTPIAMKHAMSRVPADDFVVMMACGPVELGEITIHPGTIHVCPLCHDFISAQMLTDGTIQVFERQTEFT